LAASSSASLPMPVEISATIIRQLPFADYCESAPARCVAHVVSAAPLPGCGLITVDAGLLGPLVEAFFGGSAGDSAASGDAAFSSGAQGIAKLWCRQLLDTLREVWKPLRELSPELVSTQLGFELIEAIGEADSVIASDFEVTIANQRGSFSVIWPESMIAALVPALQGKRPERDLAADARFEKALRRRLADVPVALTSDVGHAALTLGALVKLAPGDLVPNDSPRLAIVMAQGVRLLQGRFGVQAGRNAIETIGWLQPQTKN
jgi:flagellar motor switch protein FliM